MAGLVAAGASVLVIAVLLVVIVRAGNEPGNAGASCYSPPSVPKLTPAECERTGGHRWDFQNPHYGGCSLTGAPAYASYPCTRCTAYRQGYT